MTPLPPGIKNPLRPSSQAAKIAHSQEVMLRLNDRFHDAMQEAQQSYGSGLPINLLALFFGIQINNVCNKYPEFMVMVDQAAATQAIKGLKGSSDE